MPILAVYILPQYSAPGYSTCPRFRLEIAAHARARTAAPITSPVSEEMPDGISTENTGMPEELICSAADLYLPVSGRESPAPKSASTTVLTPSVQISGDISIPSFFKTPSLNALSSEHFSGSPTRVTETRFPFSCRMCAIAMPSPPLLPVPQTNAVWARSKPELSSISQHARAALSISSREGMPTSSIVCRSHRSICRPVRIFSIFRLRSYCFMLTL